jgi:uncharacterized protein YjdB
MKKINFNAVYGILALAAVMLLAGCLNPFEPQLDRGKKAAEGNGYVTISINKADGRTILPENTQDSFSQYRLDFFVPGQTLNPVQTEFLEPDSITDEIEMPVGTYDLWVTAYTNFISKEDDSQNTAVAKGSSLGLKVENNKPTGASVKLFAIEDGMGTFKWSISYPAGAKATITIEPLDEWGTPIKVWTIADTPSEENEKGKADSVELRSGTYRVTFDLLDTEERSLRRSDILHVYMNMESFFGKNGEGDFKEDYFIIKRVSNIALKVATVPTNTPLTLEGVVSPSNATFQDIEWEIIDDPENTGATLTDGVFFAKLATRAGSKVTLRATIEHGAGYLTDYVQDDLEVTVTYVEVSGVEVEPDKIELEDGMSKLITARVLPITATDKRLSWGMAVEGIFEIIEEGYEDGTVEIKALTYGTTDVLVKAVDNTRAEAECSVTVKEVPLTGLTLSADYVMLPVGGSTELKAIFAPPNASHKKLTWSSDVPSVKVDEDDGIVTVNSASPSQAIISVTNSEGLITAKCLVIIDGDAVGITGVDLHTDVFSRGIKLQVGKSTQLKCTITPDDVDPIRVFWSSGDFNVVSVVDNGKIRIGHGNPEPDDPDYDEVFEDADDLPDGTITARKPGIVDIVVTVANGGKFKVCRVEAYAEDPAKPSIEEIELPKGLHFTRGFDEYIEPIFTPDNTGNKNLLWYSSDTSIAEVGLTTGLVTAKVPGKTTISVFTEDRGLTADCEIEVDFVPVTSVKIITDTLRMDENQKVTLRYTVYPAHATYKEVEWFIEEGGSAVATVNETTGEVTYRGGGTKATWLYVRTIPSAQQTETFTAQCRIRDRDQTPKVTGIRLNVHKLRAATDPETPPMPLVATITPADAYYNKDIDLSWYSTDTSVAEVKDGQVTGKSAGKAQIIVMTHDGGFIDTCELEVYEGRMAVTGIQLNTDEVKLVYITRFTMFPSIQLFHSLQPFGTTGEVIWEAANNPRLGIDQTGKVISDDTSAPPSTDGTVTITAISVEGGFTTTCTVGVKVYNPGTVYSYSSKVSYFSLNTESLDLEVGRETTLTAMDKMFTGSYSTSSTYYYFPEEVVWYSTNPAVAVVDAQTGVVTAKTPGETTIIATLVEGGVMKNVAVTVRAKGTDGPAVDGVRLNTNEMTIFRGQRAGAPLQAFIQPFKDYESVAANTAFYWSSSNSRFVEVDQNGLVTSINTSQNFTATIMATTIDGGYTDTCTVNVKQASGIPATGLTSMGMKYLTLNLRSNVLVGEYNYGTFKPVILPLDSTGKSTATDQTLVWQNSNPAIAELNEANGRITALALGKTLVTATTINGYSQSVEVTVVPAGPGGMGNAAIQSVSRVVLTPATLTLRAPQTITAVVEPVNAPNKNVTWSSSNPNMVTVDANGTVTLVHAKYLQTVTITATSVDGGRPSDCTVTIGMVPEVLISGHTAGNFYMGKYTITQAEYQAVIGSNPSQFASNPASGEIQIYRPVENVTYSAMRVFCNQLSEREGLTPAYSNPATSSTITNNRTGYRLPSRTQWEYACKAGTTTTYYWGNSWDNAYGWCEDNSNGYTHEVGKKLPNPWGLYDMSGNVREPVNESNSSTKGGAYSDRNYYCTSDYNPTGPYDGSWPQLGLRVIRPAP